jgi:hypothetical protein
MNDQGSNTTNGTCSLVLIAFFLFPVIGFFVGVGINYGLFVLENNPSWERIPTPPSPPLEVVYAEPGCVYINAVDENNYFFCDKYGTENDSWQSYDEIEHHEAEIPCPDTFPDYPDDALQTIEFCLGKEYIDNTQFALFNDGSIKIRRIQGDPWGSLYRGVFLSLGGGVLGVFAVIGFYLSRKSKSQKDLPT